MVFPTLLALSVNEFVMDKFTFDRFDIVDLEKKFSEIMKRLINKSKSKFFEIKYEKNKKGFDTELNFPENNEDFLEAIGNEAPAVYCIWLKETQKEFVPIYIGHAKEPKTRMGHHLSKKHKETGAVLKQVKNAVSSEGKIGVTFVKIRPPYMRVAVEKWLIDRIGKDTLLWNKRGGK